MAMGNLQVYFHLRSNEARLSGCDCLYIKNVSNTYIHIHIICTIIYIFVQRERERVNECTLWK